METNWNQLIERYLQNELSEEGRTAFEQELQVNPELREELELHQLVQSAAKRASQRTIVQQAGKSYLRNLRIKQFTAGVLITMVTTVGIVYWVQNKKQTEKNEPKHEAVVINSKELKKETANSKDTIFNQPNQTGDKSSLIQSSDWNVVEEHRAHSTVSFKTVKSENRNATFSRSQTELNLAYQPVTVKLDTISLPKAQVTILGFTNDELNDEVLEANSLTDNSLLSATWVNKYDSVGKFNDLYCGYALVMDQSRFGFVDPNGKVFIPLIYDQIVVTANIKSSKQKNKRQKKKVLYIPKRSGKDVKDCEEEFIRLEMNRDSLK